MPLTAPADPVPSELTPRLLAALQAVSGYPCVSLLLTTRPATRMDRVDVERLERLRLNAVSRLAAEGLLDDAQDVVTALDRLVQSAMAGPTGQGLALFAGGAAAQAVRLELAVDDRAVIDATFATRDLVRALHRTPRHVVLVLSDRGAALLDGAGGRLTPAVGTAFPMDLTPLDGEVYEGERWLSLLRGVDLGLGSYLRLHPAPLVLAGPPDVLTAFRSVSRNMSRLAGTVDGPPADADLDDRAVLADLGRRTRPVLTGYLASRQRSAAALLEERQGQGRVAPGVAEAWLAARTRRPEMLVVEEGYRLPARLSPDGDEVVPADDVEAPDVVDDLVDELIELVLARGGWIALAQDGSLTRYDRVALTVY